MMKNQNNGLSKLSPRNNNSSTPSPRLVHIVICFGLLLVTLQFVYNAQSSSANEETLDRIRLLGHGVDVGDESDDNESSNNGQQQQQQQQRIDQMTADMAKLRKQLDGKHQTSQEEMKNLKAELKSLKEQVVVQHNRKDAAETDKDKNNNSKEKLEMEFKNELGVLKQKLEEYKTQGFDNNRDVDDSKAKEQARLQAETSKELQALKKQIEEVKAAKSAPGKTSSPEIEKEATSAPAENTTPETREETLETTIEDGKYPFAKPPVATEFVKQDGVVIATKIHGPHQLPILKQFLCLLNFAYNKKMKYDVLIFTTEALSKEEEKEIRGIGKPAKVQIVVDNPGLHKLIDELEPHKRELFLRKCDVADDPEKLKNLTWFSNCKENGRTSRLAYNWQAEFRAMRIWNHRALKPYKFMLWIDADAFCTEEWKRDPVAFFIEHKLAIFFDNFGAGTTPGGFPEFKQRFMTAFNRTISDIELVEGHLTSQNNTGPVRQIHGFMHMTDLEFFRSEPVMHWARTLIGDEFLSRRFDDQLAVTAPAVVLAPERAWDMRANGVTLNVFHNGLLDGKERAPAYNFMAYWNDKGGKDVMPGSKETCEITANGWQGCPSSDESLPRDNHIKKKKKEYSTTTSYSRQLF